MLACRELSSAIRSSRPLAVKQLVAMYSCPRLPSRVASLDLALLLSPQRRHDTLTSKPYSHHVPQPCSRSSADTVPSWRCAASQNGAPASSPATEEPARPQYIPGSISDPSYVRIFDTTLRDGEQSPGATLTVKEKLEIARQLAKLGVDVIEAGFPVASPGDFEAVRTIALEVGNNVDAAGYVPVICGLSRTSIKYAITAASWPLHASLLLPVGAAMPVSSACAVYHVSCSHCLMLTVG